MLALAATLLLAQMPGPIEVPLNRQVTGLDFAGTREANQMYMPGSIRLSQDRPAHATKTPAPWGNLLFGSFVVGNGADSEFFLALQVNGEDSRLFIDANQNGDFTDDPAASWTKLPARAEGQAPSWQGTNVVNGSYVAGDRSFRSPYGLNFFWSPGRTQIGFYRATVLTADIQINGSTVSIRVMEDGNDGVFNRRFDLSEDHAGLRPVQIVMNGSRKDARGTFDFNGVNYLADLAPDGSRLVLTPTFRVVRSQAPPPTPPRPLLAPGTPAPDFVAHAPNGDPMKLSDHLGKIVVLKFWATWCGPCIASMPHFQDVYNQTKDQDVRILAVCVSDDREAFDRWVPANRARFTFPVYFDPAGRNRQQAISSALYNVSGIPAVYIIGRDGKVVESVIGYSEGDKRV
ncbi:MAG: TlpA family protein disulfide reductase, partial [Fimbriimonadaceae bacterium]|nr:TlpA family protein disulfide reductase [Fimbriimonadaceae bacterium]